MFLRNFLMAGQNISSINLNVVVFYFYLLEENILCTLFWMNYPQLKKQKAYLLPENLYQTIKVNTDLESVLLLLIDIYFN